MRSRGAVVSPTAGFSASPEATGLTRRASGNCIRAGAFAGAIRAADVIDPLLVAPEPSVAAAGAGRRQYRRQAGSVLPALTMRQIVEQSQPAR